MKIEAPIDLKLRMMLVGVELVGKFEDGRRSFELANPHLPIIAEDRTAKRLLVWVGRDIADGTQVSVPEDWQHKCGKVITFRRDPFPRVSYEVTL